MIKDDIIFCQFRNGQTKNYDIQAIRKIVDGIAITIDGYKVDAATGIEENKKYGTRVWEVLTSKNRDEYLKTKEYIRAKKWLKKVEDFPELTIQAFKTCTSTEESDKREFFHSLDSETFKMLYTENMASIQSSFRKPIWCGHPFALSGWFGCPRLLKGKDLTERMCQECSCFVNPKYGDYFKRLRLIAALPIDKVGNYLGIKDYRELENGQRRAKSEEIEKLIELYCLKDWYFVDVLKMLYTPKQERDPELDELYRTTIQQKIRKR